MPSLPELASPFLLPVLVWIAFSFAAVWALWQLGPSDVDDRGLRPSRTWAKANAQMIALSTGLGVLAGVVSHFGGEGTGLGGLAVIPALVGFVAVLVASASYLVCLISFVRAGLSHAPRAPYARAVCVWIVASPPISALSWTLSMFAFFALAYPHGIYIG